LCSISHAAPRDIATYVYYTGIKPFTRQEVYVARGLRDRKMQRVLMQFFKPESWFTVCEALIGAQRADLIGNGCDCLIPANPAREALEKRRRDAPRAALHKKARQVGGVHFHPSGGVCGDELSQEQVW
jgi:hypothetical protein